MLDRDLVRADTSRNKVNDLVKLQFDEMISAPCRLGILATLIPGKPVTFMEMKAATSSVSYTHLTLPTICFKCRWRGGAGG